MSTHTPGLWHYRNHSRDENCKLIYCGAPSTQLSGYCGEANARMIVASPDLLAACQMFMHTVQHPEIKGEPGSLLEVMRDAIEKATGNSV